ncbi:hypothetical protein PG911_12525 [Tenacibaculum ovolyticum]|uniref:hypothetical protein n=1 Tax=Tenacibaculum ovolyticum TaxID=104270 RepID=UPI0003F75D24|nr:hypothetical protein [Tenacibaculum ovolyticum]WBX75480.1 hypothetical protein PG911_12525 [Tenacibaculum ovolyticum]
MANATLEALEVMNETTGKQLKLIDGKFTKREVLNIIGDVVNLKINFHKLQRLSRTEGNINDECTYDNSRITELITDKTAMKAFLNSLENNGRNIKVSSTIHISIED